MTVLITLRQIKEAGACQRGWRRVRKAKRGLSLDHAFPLVDILDSNNLADAVWCLANLDIASPGRAHGFVYDCIVRASDYGDATQRTKDYIVTLESYFRGNLPRKQVGILYPNPIERFAPLPTAIQYLTHSIASNSRHISAETEEACLHVAAQMRTADGLSESKSRKEAELELSRVFRSNFG